jgi:hypothetical protein
MSSPHAIPDELRRAAALMRERAEEANTDDARRPYGDRNADPVPPAEWGALVDNYLGGKIGAHCAAWTPAVALAVAEWLEIGADPYACVDSSPMLAVARAYVAGGDGHA